MTEILFYHLTEQTYQQALPGLLERSLERDWRVVVQLAQEADLAPLSSHLWSWSPTSFLPHGAQGDEETDPSCHPIWLTTTGGNPNSANIRFLIGGAISDDLDTYQRAIIMFDGRDENAVADARSQWKSLKSRGMELTYWQQDEQGRWAKRA